MGIETVKVIDEYGAFGQPLPVKLTPKRLAPTGIGYRQMQAVALHAVPILSCYKVSQCIFIAVCGNFWISGSTAGEKHQRGILAAGTVFFSLKFAAEEFIFLVKIMPALSFGAY